MYLRRELLPLYPLRVMPWRQWPVCPACGSADTIRVELPFSPDVFVCIACRYQWPPPEVSRLDAQGALVERRKKPRI